MTQENSIQSKTANTTGQLNIFQKIVGIMSELNYIQKGPKTVNGQYRFASHDQVTSAIHPLLVKYGVVVVPDVIDQTQENNRTTVKLNMYFVNADNPQDQFKSTFYGYGVDSGDKGPGKAVSYAFKYGILKTFCLETGDDPDNEPNATYEPAKCLDFDSKIMIGLDAKDTNKMTRYLDYCGQVMNKHPEDVKRQALTRVTEFMESFKKWDEKTEPKRKGTK